MKAAILIGDILNKNDCVGKPQELMVTEDRIED